MAVISIIAAILTLGVPSTETASLAGQVVDAQGRPLAGARVFMEPGLAGALVEVASGNDGAWRFENVAPGGVGVFAIAGGHAFGGTHVYVAFGDSVQGVTICLTAPASVSGKVTDHKKHPVKDARITRVALLGATKVGIPLAKLKAFGFAEPSSDEKGRFTVPDLPEGGTVVLKVAHPRYAQEGISGIPVGGPEVTVRLYRGVVVEGDVLTRDTRSPVVGAAVIVRNAQPPHDTAITKTNAAGAFAVRLKPGVYMYQATSAVFHSPGWKRLTLTAQEPPSRLRLYVAGAGRILGKVCDAVSGEPIAGTKLTLSTQGNVAAVARTGAAGEFVFEAMDGENVVHLEYAPGYFPPDQPAITVPVAEGKDVALPTFWVAPIPTYKILVVDASMAPVLGVVVSLLRPKQFGWQVTDDEGMVELRLSSAPRDGEIVGMAEHVTEPLGALFSLEREETEAKVLLLKLGTVRGHVVAEKNTPVAGAIVGAVFGEARLLLWQTVSDRAGAFEWGSVVPLVGQRCAAHAGGGAFGDSPPFELEEGEAKELGRIAVREKEDAARVRSVAGVRGKKLAWYDNRLVAGVLPDRKTRKRTPAVVVYCRADEAPMVLEALAAARDMLPPGDLLWVMVVDGGYACDDAPILVLAGRAPGPGSTYLVGSDGKVVLETFGMPPLRGVQRLMSP